MSDFPDVLGMELHDATALLEAEGLPFIIVETKPVKKEPAEGVFRQICCVSYIVDIDLAFIMLQCIIVDGV